VDGSGGQVRREQVDEVGAVHAEGCVPAGGVAHLDRRDRRTVVAEIPGARTHARAPLLDGGAEPDALQMAHCVRRHEQARADFPQRGRLFVNGNAQTVCDQRIRGEQAADAASDDQDAWLRFHPTALPSAEG
jgi:hypothetical protein